MAVAARKLTFLTDRDDAADDGRMSWDFAASAEDYRKLTFEWESRLRRVFGSPIYLSSQLGRSALSPPTREKSPGGEVRAAT